MRPETVKAVSERLHEFAPELSPDTHARMIHAMRCSEAMEILRAIEFREIVIPQEQRERATKSYSGVIEYQLPNGWWLEVFNDCDEWDYLEAIGAPDGWSVYYSEMPDWLRDWRPLGATADSIWGLSP